MNAGRSDLEHRVRQAFGELLPAMTADGGGADLSFLDGGTVSIRLIGSCVFCPSQALSADALRRGIRARVPDVAEILISADRVTGGLRDPESAPWIVGPAGSPVLSTGAVAD